MGEAQYKAAITTLSICGIVALFILKIGVKTRTIIPMLYWLALQTIWSEFQATHMMLAHGIGYAMLVMVLLSWVVTFVHFIQRSRSVR